MIYGYIESVNNVPRRTRRGPATSTHQPHRPRLPRPPVRRRTQSEFRAIEDRLRSGSASAGPAATTASSPSRRPAQWLAVNPIPARPHLHRVRLPPRLPRRPHPLPQHPHPRSRARTTSAPRSSTTSPATRTGRSSAAAPPRSGAAPSEFIQTPGHARDLGIELDGKIYFQSRDGTLNDNPNKKGGFYTQLEYGVLFPLGGLGYLPVQQTNYANSTQVTGPRSARRPPRSCAGTSASCTERSSAELALLAAPGGR